MGDTLTKSGDFTDTLLSLCKSLKPVIPVSPNVTITITESNSTDFNLLITISVLYILKLFFYCLCTIFET